MKLFPILVLSLALLAGCAKRPPVYRASVKLLVTHSSEANPRENGEQFALTQADVLRSQTMLRRTQERLKKMAEEVRDNLTDLQVSPIRGSAIILVEVDSSSAEFAKDFANALAEVYLKFRDEQRAATSESALLPFTRQVSDLSQELKAINEKLAVFDKEHSVSTNAELLEQKALYEDRERVRNLYNVSLAKLVKMDEARSRNEFTVSILESAVVEVRPTHHFFR